jgi:hypothetical protein
MIIRYLTGTKFVMLNVKICFSFSSLVKYVLLLTYFFSFVYPVVVWMFSSVLCPYAVSV